MVLLNPSVHIIRRFWAAFISEWFRNKLTPLHVKFNHLNLFLTLGPKYYSKHMLANCCFARCLDYPYKCHLKQFPLHHEIPLCATQSYLYHQPRTCDSSALFHHQKNCKMYRRAHHNKKMCQCCFNHGHVRLLIQHFQQLPHGINLVFVIPNLQLIKHVVIFIFLWPRM